MSLYNHNIFLIMLLVFSLPVYAATPKTSAAPKEPIEITARDSFSWDQAQQSYIAIGAVHVIQGDSQLFADHVIAYYAQTATPDSAAPPPAAALGSAEAGPGNGQQISQIIATGHVHIIHLGDDLTGDKAIYDKPKNLVTLTGQNVVIKSEGKILTGATKVVYDMATSQAKAVTTPGQGRLKALLQ